ncbi:MAG: four helix bundle protein [Anaerolineales bacterium]|nr:MAG: four helix bundle protein [Anaerolineales bacterium]
MNYQEWKKTVPEEITQDPLWGLEVYRLGFFIADITWNDTEALFKNPSTRNAADQIRRSLDGISANIAEGYSRSTGKIAPATLNTLSAKPAKQKTASTKSAMPLSLKWFYIV